MAALKQTLRDTAQLLTAPVRRAITIAWIFGTLATVSVALNWLFPSEVQPEFAERLFLRMIGGWLFNIIIGWSFYLLPTIVAAIVMRLLFRHPVVGLVYKLVVYIYAALWGFALALLAGGLLPSLYPGSFVFVHLLAAALSRKSLARFVLVAGVSFEIISISFFGAYSLIHSNFLQSPEKVGAHKLDERSYYSLHFYSPDILIGTDREHVNQLTIGDSLSLSRKIIYTGSYPERIHQSNITNRFYVSDEGVLVFDNLSLTGTLRLHDFRYPKVVEDPVSKTLWTAEEWWGKANVISMVDGHLIASLEATPGSWTWPHLTADIAGRRLWRSSMLISRDIRLYDLDSRQLIKKADDLSVYMTVFDPKRQLLWGGRPFLGEIIGLDDELKIQKRIKVGFFIRGVLLGSDGLLYATTFPFGEVYQIDPDSGKIIWQKHCGWKTRGFTVDSERDLVWCSSDHGLFVLDLN